MPRQLRVEYPGAIYHVLNRGDRKKAVFLDDVDRQDFLKTLAEACQKTGFQVHAYCLMKNHFHLVVETPRGNLVAGLRWFLSAYTIRFNHRHKLCGHVFSGRYKSLVVDGSCDGYLRTACDYTHLNPARAGLLADSSRLLEYPWSSFGGYLADPKHRPAWLRVDRLLGEHGLAEDTAKVRREFERRMENRRHQEGDPAQWQGMRRGWCLGGDEFKKSLLQRMQGQVGASHFGALQAEVEWDRAQKLIAQELKKRGWQEADLQRRSKKDAEKIELAAMLRENTTLTVGQIAGRLHLGHRNTLNNRLYERRKNHAAKS